MMGIDATERKSLVSMFDRGLEKFGVEQTVVSVEVTGSDAMRVKDAFEGLFRRDSGGSIHFSHQMNVGKIAEVVDEYSSSNIANK
jgi:hypothetical protein